MCWFCRPTCSNCKPAEKLFIKCDSCGKPQCFTREEFLHYSQLPHRKNELERTALTEGSFRECLCSDCGKDLHTSLQHAVTPRPCLRSKITCGYPCGIRKTKHQDNLEPCKHMVPLGRYDSPELPEDDPLRR